MHFDLVIVGGGVVGASLAAALSTTSFSVALIEAKRPSLNDPRLFALNYTSCQLLANVGIWDDIAAEAAPIHRVHVSRRGHFGATQLNHDDVDLPNLGHVIPAHQIEKALASRLETLENVTVFCPATLIAMQRHENHVSINIKTDERDLTLTTHLILGADGAESTLRHLSAIPVTRYDYQQSALVTRTTLQRSHEQIAYERFVKNGAIAMLPLRGHQCATIWTGPTQQIQQLANLDEKQFLNTLQTTFGYRLGRLKNISSRHVFPLQRIKAQQIKDAYVFLLGNAAHALHPIAAQGFNLALYEVAWLVEQLQSMTVPNAYVLHEQRHGVMQQENMTTTFSHYLAELFNGNTFLRDSLIQAGLASLDLAVPLKRQLINRLLGRHKRLPKLLLSNEHEKIIT